MASPKTPPPSTSSGNKAISIVPEARVMKTPLTDDSIWKRLKEAGFDEECIKRRDKAALVSYIASLEAKVFDLQQHISIHILEKKELASQYEQIKSSYDSSELSHRHQQAAHLSTIAEYVNREGHLKKSMGLEKALHEMRAESAERRIATESKIEEARALMEKGNKKYIEATLKLQAAESLHGEATMLHRSAERKLFEVEAREADLTMRVNTFRIECESREKEIEEEKKALKERRGVWKEEQDRLLDDKMLVNQREEDIVCKMQELSRLEKELELCGDNAMNTLRAIEEEKSNMCIAAVTMSLRETDIVDKEASLKKREYELTMIKASLLNKNSAEAQKLIAQNDTFLAARRSSFEKDLDAKRKTMEDEIDEKRHSTELKEVEVSRWEKVLREEAEELERNHKLLCEKESDLCERTKLLQEKERSVEVSINNVDLQRSILNQERIEIQKQQAELSKSLDSYAEKAKSVEDTLAKLEILKSETSELAALEKKLKEEVDIVRAQKLEILLREEKMEQERVKFESEWESIDEKREELFKETQSLIIEREALRKSLAEEREALKQEKEQMTIQHGKSVEMLNKEKEEYRSQMEKERLAWFNKIQKEHEDFLQGIEMQKREIESCIEKRREEVESCIEQKRKALEMETEMKKEEIASATRQMEKEREEARSEIERLEAEREAINLERKRSETEMEAMKKSVEELKKQTVTLEKQREALRIEREEISGKIESLNELNDLKMESERKQSTIERDDAEINEPIIERDNVDALTDISKAEVTPNATSFSWIKRYAGAIFGTPKKVLGYESDDLGLASVEKFEISNGSHMKRKFAKHATHSFESFSASARTFKKRKENVQPSNLRVGAMEL